MGRPKGTLTLRREDGRIVCDSVQVADSAGRRLRGLLGRGSLAPGEGIVLRPAWSIHTAFMRFPIDVVFVDAEQVVMRVEPSLRPFKTASCRGAREVVELVAGECQRRGLVTGDRVAWASRSAVTAIATRESPNLRADRRGTVLVASTDQRFIKLSRFLLEGRGIAVGDQPVQVALAGSLAEADIDALLLDAGASIGEGMRALNAARVQRPEIPVVLVLDAPGDRAPVGVAVYDKWHGTSAAIDAVEEAIAGSRSE